MNHVSCRCWNAEWFTHTIAADGMWQDSGLVGLGRPPSRDFLLKYLSKSIIKDSLSLQLLITRTYSNLCVKFIRWLFKFAY